MTGHHKSTAVNAQLKVFALLKAHGVPASEADDLVAGAVAGAQCQVVKLDGTGAGLSGLAVRGRAG